MSEIQDRTFWEDVYYLRQKGLILRQWTRKDLNRHLAQRYSLNTINTVPSNQSMKRDGSEKGDYVKRGQQAKAWRVDRGEFELIDDPQDIPGARGIRSELGDPKEARLQNIIDMGLHFSTMIRLFEEGSKRGLCKEILSRARQVFTAESEGQFKEIHSDLPSKIRPVLMLDWRLRKGAI